MANSKSAKKSATHIDKTTAKETAKVARVMSPETVVADELPPKPDYPRYRVTPNEPIQLSQIDPDTCESYQSKKEIEAELEYYRDRLSLLQERLYAEQQRSLLIVLQAMDTGGKDGTIKHVFQGVNPQGRRALGATQQDIMAQFILEVALLSLIGGTIAIGTVHGIAVAVADTFNLPYQFESSTASLALASALLVGMGAGFIPALRASQLDPVKALRSE